MGQQAIATLFDGHVDGVDDDGFLFGWASTSQPGVAARLLVRIDGVTVGDVVADQFREDLIHGGLPNSSCAFWYPIPEDMRDGREHRAEIIFAFDGRALRSSPHPFRLGDGALAEAPRGDNLIPNAGFDSWPGGLRVAVAKRFTEFCSGWLFDFRKNTHSIVTCSVDKARDLALLPDAYALRIDIEQAPLEGYQRIIVPFAPGATALHDLRLSLGMRRPPHAEPGALHIREIFLGAVAKTKVRKIGTVRRMLAPRGTLRLLGVPITSDRAIVLAPEEVPAIVIDLAGNGELTLFSPELGRGSPPPRDAHAIVGAFEDPWIQEQIPFLRLGQIWGARLPALAGDLGKEPATVHPARAPRGHDGVPFIQIVVPVFNAAVHVEDLLRSIQACTPTPHEILIFDDGSDEYTRERISRWEAIDPRIRYHRHPSNLGYTRNINVAVQSTVADYVLLINSDTIVTPNWLTKMYQTLMIDDQTAAVGPLSNAASWQSIPRTRTPTGDWMLNLLPDGMTPADVAALVEQLSAALSPEFPLLNGFCTLFRRAAIEAAGYFDDQAFPEGYGEENDLCLRLGRLGYRLRIADDAYVHHKKSVSFGAGRRKTLTRRANMLLRSRHPESGPMRAGRAAGTAATPTS